MSRPLRNPDDPREPGEVPLSLRRWLQSSTVLAVLAGYALLMLLKIGLSSIERRAEHRRLVEQVAAVLPSRVARVASLPLTIDTELLPDLQVLLLPAAPPQPPRLHREAGRVWMESRSPLLLRGGQSLALKIRHDVTASLAAQDLSLQLLAVAAGVSALFTSALLRLVLRRGLVQPLQDLGDKLAAFGSLLAPPPPLDVAAQPLELQPIAASFNALQERLWASWERQRSFVDGVAHELRTPITLISGHAQSLRRLPAAASLAPQLALISDEARRMGAMVSDMLDLARRDAGRLELRRQWIDCAAALLESYERLAPACAGRLQLDLPEEEGDLLLVTGDPDRLQQCLAALIDNAMRYSSGSVSLCLNGRDGWPVLHVRDQGPGVAPEERQVIFERFARGSSSLDTRGSGIGLSVVQLLMQAMGGRVSVEDAPGGGADFGLHLPPWNPGQPGGQLSEAGQP